MLTIYLSIALLVLGGLAGFAYKEPFLARTLIIWVAIFIFSTFLLVRIFHVGKQFAYDDSSEISKNVPPAVPLISIMNMDSVAIDDPLLEKFNLRMDTSSEQKNKMMKELLIDHVEDLVKHKIQAAIVSASHEDAKNNEIISYCFYSTVIALIIIYWLTFVFLNFKNNKNIDPDNHTN